MMQNPETKIINFFKTHKLFIRKGEEREITHLLLNGEYGGKVSVPDNKIKAFELAYGEDIQNGKDVFVVEQKSKVFKMHFDVDFSMNHTDTELESIINTLISSVQSFLANPSETDQLQCIVCAVLDETKISRKTSNLHLIFPKVYVNSDIAVWIRSYAIAKLRKDFPTFDESKGWDDIIDIAVLTQNGLRMVGSDKIRSCSECKGIRTQQLSCNTCARKGWRAEGKVYWPWRVYPNTRSMKRIIQNAAHAASQCSTRLPSGISPTNMIIPLGAPNASQLMKKRKREGVNYYQEYNPRCQTGYTDYSASAEQFDMIKSIFAEIHIKFADLSINKMMIKENKSGLYYLVRVRGFYERFCINKGSEHTSSTIYFSISDKGISQRCHCVKNEVRTYGKCSEFTSKKILLPSKLQNSLFKSRTLKVNDTADNSISFETDPGEEFVLSDIKKQRIHLAVPLLPFP